MAVGGARRDAQDLGGLVGRQAGEVAEFDQLGLFRVGLGEAIEALVESQEFLVGCGGRETVHFHLLPVPAPAALERLAASGLFGPPDVKALLIVQLVTQGALALGLATPHLAGRMSGFWQAARVSPLRRYLLAGISIGIMSPFSTLWSRAELAHQLSWEEAAQVQALWRASEWVNGIAGGLIGLVFLPRMAAATGRAEFLQEMWRTIRLLCLPAAVIYVVFWAAQGWIMPFLYSEKFLMGAAASALFLLGDAVRLASWVPLHGLFASERTTAIAVGEFLSLPLFALLLTLVPQTSLVVTGACYAATFAIYLCVNLWCVLMLPGRYAKGAA